MGSNSSKAVIIIGVLIALGLGLFGGYMIGNMNANKTEEQSASTVSTEQTDLRVGLNNLLREHVTSSLVVTRNIAIVFVRQPGPVCAAEKSHAVYFNA